MEKLINNAVTYLNEDINNMVTSFDVTDGTLFPEEGNFALRINNELLICTERTADTLTVLRGQENTLAVNHLKGDPVTAILTKRSLQQYIQDQVIISQFDEIPDFGIPHRKWIQADGPLTAYDSLTQWLFRLNDHWINLPTFVGSWINQDSAIFDDTKGYYTLTNLNSDDEIHAYLFSIPASPYVITAYIEAVGIGGIILRNSTTDEIIIFSVNQLISKWDNETTINANYDLDSEFENLNGTKLWLRIEDDETDRIYSISLNPSSGFVPILITLNDDFIAPDQVGIFVFDDGIVNLYSWDVD